MAQRLKQPSQQDWPSAPSVAALQVANDNCPIPDLRPGKLIAEAMLAWLATFLFGGIALAKGIEIVAKLFHEPGFAELKDMGFTMGAVLGIGLAIAHVTCALRNRYR